MSLSVLQVPSLPAFLPALPLAVADLLSPCLRGTRKSPIPAGNANRSGGTLRRPRPVLLQLQRNSAPPPPSAPQGSPRSSPTAGDHQELQEAMAPSSPDAGPSCAESDEGAQGPEV
ncbi:hypothetical protein E5288_WYG014801 [Bos mutus]|uniref:Melanoma associated antigen N-terminal domain-containing protein n=1 Tax=Bos mutus TaxID=72004 RepID=A0A6B0SB34_9CETA|nr:hypothetical protein [Bos mutus]